MYNAGVFLWFFDIAQDHGEYNRIHGQTNSIKIDI